MARKKKKIPLLSDNNTYGWKQERLGPYWVWTFALNNNQKASLLEEISNGLNLGLKIGIRKKGKYEL